MRRRIAALGFAAAAICCVAADWRVAESGWRYEFPRDHHSHPEFKTEWWYFTGNVADADGKRFGYQLTFFRQGIRHPHERAPEMSRFVIGDLKFAHFTITDVAAERFHFQQKTSRGAFGESGFDEGDRLAWIDDWTLSMRGDDAFELVASSGENKLRLEVRATKRPVIHGADGISIKASVEGHASHYYSMTRMATSGELVIGGKARAVQGESWFDHEWATNQLAPDQIGWDWLSVHLEDGSELMLYQLRLSSGAADPSSSGTFIAADGSSIHLPSSAFRMTPTAFWKSGKTAANYPIGWRIEVPGHGLDFTVRAAAQNQELALMPLAYWEGAIDVEGTRGGRPIKGQGYLELTGYAGPLRELQR